MNKLEINYKKTNSFLITAVALLSIKIILAFLVGEITNSSLVGIPMIIFFFILHFKYNNAVYVLITDSKIIKNNIFYKEEVISSKITNIQYSNKKYRLKTPTKTLKIDTKLIELDSLKSFSKQMERIRKYGNQLH